MNYALRRTPVNRAISSCCFYKSPTLPSWVHLKTKVWVTPPPFLLVPPETYAAFLATAIITCYVSRLSISSCSHGDQTLEHSWGPLAPSCYKLGPKNSWDKFVLNMSVHPGLPSSPAAFRRARCLLLAPALYVSLPFAGHAALTAGLNLSSCFVRSFVHTCTWPLAAASLNTMCLAVVCHTIMPPYRMF